MTHSCRSRRGHPDEELIDVVLVGHSFGGMPITGVADRIPERSLILSIWMRGPESGETAFQPFRGRAEARIALAKSEWRLAFPPMSCLRVRVVKGLQTTLGSAAG